MKKMAIGKIIIIVCYLFLPHFVFADAVKSADQLILISISNRIIQFYENGELKKQYKIAVGKKQTPTPVGNGYIYKKRKQPVFRYVDEGPKKGEIIRWSRIDNGKLVKIPYKKMRALAFRINGHKTDKYSIHSTTEKNSIGKAVSNGCVRMKIKDLLELYPMVKKGAKVIINQ